MKKRYIVLATLGVISAIGAGLVLHKHKQVEEHKELYFPDDIYQLSDFAKYACVFHKIPDDVMSDIVFEAIRFSSSEQQIEYLKEKANKYVNEVGHEDYC